MVRLIAASLLTTVGLCAFPAIAQSGAERLAPVHFDTRFEAVPFGAKMDALMTYVGQSVNNRYQARINATPDPHLRDRYRAAISVEVQAIRDSLVAFRGQQSGYNVSVVSREFAHNTEESMLVVPVGHAHDYLFLIDGTFWKLVTTVPNSEGLAVFLVKFAQVYGAPDHVEYADAERRAAPRLARWSAGSLRIIVEERSDYGAIVIRWIRGDAQSRVDTLRGDNSPPADSGGQALDPTILDIMQD